MNTRSFRSLPAKEQKIEQNKKRCRAYRENFKRYATPEQLDAFNSKNAQRQHGYRLKKTQAGENAEASAKNVAQADERKKSGRRTVKFKLLPATRQGIRRKLRRALPELGGHEIIELGQGALKLADMGVDFSGEIIDVEDRKRGNDQGAQSGRMIWTGSSIPESLEKELKLRSLTPILGALSMLRTRPLDSKPQKGGVPDPKTYQDLHRDLDALHPTWGIRQMNAWIEYIYLVFIPLIGEGGVGGPYNMLIGADGGSRNTIREVPQGSAIVIRMDTFHAGPYFPGEDPDRLYLPCIGPGKKDKLPDKKTKMLILSHTEKHKPGNNLALALAAKRK